MTVQLFINSHQILFRTINNHRQLIIISLVDGSSRNYGFSLGENTIDEFQFFTGKSLDQEIVQFYVDQIRNDYNIED